MVKSCCINENGPIGIERLTADLRTSARTLTAGEAKYLVDYYYKMQDDRIRAAAQVRSREPGESMGWIDFVFGQLNTLETRIKTALDLYSSGQELGAWAKSITGIGPVLSAGLLAHIDITLTPHPGALWRLAGLDPTSKWIGKTAAPKLVNEILGKGKITPAKIAEIAREINRNPVFLEQTAIKFNKKDDGTVTKASLTKAVAVRPWNAKLKVLTWKIGESFVKQQSSKGGEFYGHFYVERRAMEEAANSAGKNKELALAKAQTVGAKTEAYKHYSEGLLPPGHLYARAKRWVVKLFLSHYHHVGYEMLHGKPPDRPWIITHGGHSDFIPPPNWHE